MELLIYFFRGLKDSIYYGLSDLFDFYIEVATVQKIVKEDEEK
jgi:hypothetical protein